MGVRLSTALAWQGVARGWLPGRHGPYVLPRRNAPAPPWLHTLAAACTMPGRCEALTIMLVLTTSSGVVAAAAKAPATAPIAKSSCGDAWRPLTLRCS